MSKQRCKKPRDVKHLIKKLLLVGFARGIAVEFVRQLLKNKRDLMP
jgi:hypothetical protein